MIPSSHLIVEVDLARVRQNADAVRRSAGVPIIAVVKADAYGLGAQRVAQTIADLVEGFYVFNLREAVTAKLAETGRRTIVVQAESRDPSDYLAHRAQPAVWNTDVAAALRSASPVLSVDTGQQRFGVPLAESEAIDTMLREGEIREAYTHATRPEQATAFAAAMRGRVPLFHAAGSALIDTPEARLDAVRPGLALYRGAVKVSARLVEVTDTKGPAGYTGFAARRHGVILAGYSNGLRPGPCALNSRATRILEVGMQSAFIECADEDRIGDSVELIGPQVTESDIATAWQTSAQEVLVRMTGLGPRNYL